MIVRNLYDQTTCEATVRTDHATCSYGQGAIVLLDGTAIDPIGWLPLSWTEDEAAALGPMWREWMPYPRAD